ncbi:MAG TPA: BACON domain-containing protein [Thermoanaerobaculia bacterium]|nr:BACON domain-containing protein [Thermoanaerobaculia bacterium]
MRIRIVLLALLIALPLSAASRRRAASADRCSEILSPASVSVPAAGGHAFVAVTVMGGCSWSPVANQSWITAAPASGGVSIDVGANSATAARSGLIHIRGSVVVVTQAANQIPNLISNGGFDSGIAGWSDTFSTGAGSAAWSNASVIVAPGPSSGTALITSTEVRKGYQLAQCVTVIGGRTYQTGVKTLVPADQATGQTTLAIFEYHVPGCPSLTAPYFGRIINPGASTVGTWFDNTFAWSTDFSTQSVLVVIGAGFTDSPPFRAYFDDVFVREKQ